MASEPSPTPSSNSGVRKSLSIASRTSENLPKTHSRRSSLVSFAKKINLFNPTTTSTTSIVDSSDPEHARFAPLSTSPPPPSKDAIPTTSSSPLLPATSPTKSGYGGGKGGKHPPLAPLDTAAANNLPRHLLPDSAVSPTPPLLGTNSDTSSKSSKGQTNNSAGWSSPVPTTTFRIGVSEDVNRKCRRTMEDTHSYIYDFHRPSTDTGFFAIFDGHAGRTAAEFCGKNFHLLLSKQLDAAEKDGSHVSVVEILDRTFVETDKELERISSGHRNSGCTAVVALLRWEDRVVSSRGQHRASIQSRRSSSLDSDERTRSSVDTTSNPGESDEPETWTERRRLLYTGNVGDARIVLCRRGKAVRLSYDHKGTDESEGRRIAAAGGLILNARVNGVLAVTRALGDSYMKEFISGHPYTTETILSTTGDEFMILACDGLWDVCSDQHACNLIRKIKDPEEAAQTLVSYAVDHYSTDNISVMVVRFYPPVALGEDQRSSFDIKEELEEEIENDKARHGVAVED